MAAGGVTALTLTAAQIGVADTVRTLVISAAVAAGMWVVMKVRK